MADQTFARRYLTLDVTVPADTAEATPQTTNWNLGWVLLETLTVVVPAGHATATGIAVEINGVRVVPFGGSTDWLRANDEVLTVAFDAAVGSPIVISTFNVGLYDHRFQLRALVQSIDAVAGERTARAMIPLGSG